MEAAKPSAGPETTPVSRDPFKSIQARLLILLLIVILPILAVQASSYYQRIKDRRLLEIQQNLEIARTTGQRFHFFTNDLLRQEEAAGRLLLSLQLLTPAKIESIKVLAAHNPAVSHMHWIDLQGRIMASSFPKAFSLDRRNRPDIRDVLAGKAWTLSDLYRSELNGAPVFSVSYAVRNAEGSLAGILTTVVFADRLDEILKIERVRQGSIILIDRQGRRVFQYPKSRVTWEQRPVWNNLDLIKEAQAGREVNATVVDPLDRTRKIVALCPIPPLGWTAGAGRPEKEVMAAFFSDLVNHSTLFLIVVLGAFLAALFFSRNISVPVQRLREQALALSGGDLERRVRIDGPTEIKELSRTMNRMAEELTKNKEKMLENADRISKQKEALRKANEQLEMRVQVRTAKLLQINEQLQKEVKERGAREKAYQQLHYQNELILNTAEEGIFGVDSQGRLTFVNPMAAGMMGREIEELLNQPIHDLSQHSRSDGTPVPWEECGICRSYHEGVTHNTGEEKLLRKNGTFFPIEYSSAPIWEGGRLEGAVVIFRDITERKAAEQSLKSSEERMKFLSSELLAAQEKERREIAGELHDSIGSALASIKIRVENILAHEKPDTDLIPLMNPVISSIQQTMAEIRRICKNLRPAMLDDLGLLKTLAWFCREFESTYPLTVRIQTDIHEPDIPKPLKIVIFRIVQEAMNNSAKYSQADLINLSLKRNEGVIELAVDDNGQGFDLGEVTSRMGQEKGLGLISMKERTEFSGGTFSVGTNFGRGTKIKAFWPA